MNMVLEYFFGGAPHFVEFIVSAIVVGSLLLIGLYMTYQFLYDVKGR